VVIKRFRLLDWWLNRKRSGIRRLSPAKGILVISSGGLGDTVLFAQVVERFLDLAKDGEPVTVVLRSDAMKMAFAMPPGIQAMGVDFHRLRQDLNYRRGITDSLFNAHYRLVVHTDYLRHPDLDEALVAAAQAPEAIAMEPRRWDKYDSRLRNNRRLYSRLFESGPPQLNKILRWARFADWLCGAERPILTMRLADELLVPAATLDVPPVVIQPFSAVKEKQSPPALYQRLIKSLPKGTRVVITGTRQDLEVNAEYKLLLELPGVELDDSVFEDLVPLLRAARLVISVDTALMHLAVAVGAPTLCLASAAFVGEIVPYDSAVAPLNARFIYHSMPCEGCLGSCIHPLEKGMFPCVARLDIDYIVDDVRRLINQSEDRA